jgi:pSer/pThr/pTyr-binding forkhead associated (FHA) protein
MHDGRTRKVDALEAEGPEPFLTRHRASITILSGPAAGTEYVLERKRIILGRSPDVGIQIDDPSISSEHVAFELDAAGFGIRDLASTNGVRVNGATTLASALKHGDRISLGECELQYVVEDCAPQAKSWSVEEDA